MELYQAWKGPCLRASESLTRANSAPSWMSTSLTASILLFHVAERNMRLLLLMHEQLPAQARLNPVGNVPVTSGTGSRSGCCMTSRGRDCLSKAAA